MTENDGLTLHQLQLLHAPSIHSARVKARDGLAYVEAWDIKAMMTRVFGYAGWSSECLDARIIREEQRQSRTDSTKQNWSVTAQATVRLTVHQTGAVYTEAAIANNQQPSWHEAADTALKSAESDAFKRAAINLGTQFGLSLYDSGSKLDVVRRIVAPGQREIIEDLVAVRELTGDAADAARARLQERLNVARPAETPTDAPADATGAVSEPVDDPVAADPVARAQANASKVAARRAKPAAARQAAARAALAEAEKATGLADADAEVVETAAEEATWK